MMQASSPDHFLSLPSSQHPSSLPTHPCPASAPLSANRIIPWDHLPTDIQILPSCLRLSLVLHCTWAAPSSPRLRPLHTQIPVFTTNSSACPGPNPQALSCVCSASGNQAKTHIHPQSLLPPHSPSANHKILSPPSNALLGLPFYAC